MKKMNNLTAPHIRTEAKAGHMILDILVVTVPLCVYSAVNYGMRPIWIVLLSMLAAIVSEWICCIARRQSTRTVLDGSAAVTGVIIGMVMSPMVDYWVPMIGSAFAIIVAKAPFGGYGRNVFNPAAAGIAVLSYCFPKRMFTYPSVATIQLPTTMSVGEDVVSAPSLAAQLRAGGAPAVTPMQLLLGDFAGPIGATALLVLLACVAYLIIRRTVSPWTVLPYLLTCSILAWVVPVTGISLFNGALTQVCAGYVLFTGVFLLNDPVTTPRFWLGRIVYGVGTGVLVMLLQWIGRVEAGSCFAILIMNALSPIIDRWSWHGLRYLKQWRRIAREVKAHE